VGENLLNHYRIPDAGDDSHRPAAGGQVPISMPKTRFKRCAQVIAARLSAG